jgi:predicted esterase
MAFRAAVRGPALARGVIAVGGDVPPELLSDGACAFPPVLLARGERDEWYTQGKFDADVDGLKARGADMEAVVYDGAHEWNAPVAALVGRYL